MSTIVGELGSLARTQPARRYMPEVIRKFAAQLVNAGNDQFPVSSVSRRATSEISL